MLKISHANKVSRLRVLSVSCLLSYYVISSEYSVLKQIYLDCGFKYLRFNNNSEIFYLQELSKIYIKLEYK